MKKKVKILSHKKRKWMSSNCSTHLYSQAQVTSENFTLDFLGEFSFWHQVWTTACFPGDTSSQEPTCQCRRHRDVGLIPGLGRSPGGGRGNPLQHCCLENPMDRGAWRATVSQKVFQKSWTQLSDLHTHGPWWHKECTDTLLYMIRQYC